MSNTLCTLTDPELRAYAVGVYTPIVHMIRERVPARIWIARETEDLAPVQRELEARGIEVGPWLAECRREARERLRAGT